MTPSLEFSNATNPDMSVIIHSLGAMLWGGFQENSLVNWPVALVHLSNHGKYIHTSFGDFELKGNDALRCT